MGGKFEIDYIKQCLTYLKSHVILLEESFHENNRNKFNLQASQMRKLLEVMKANGYFKED